MLDPLIDAALQAGARILEVRASAVLGTTQKSDGSPVTLADAAAEGAILPALAAAFPGVPVVAEEEAAAGRIPEVGERFFLVDALDGTRDFVAGGDDFTVNIGLIEHGAPVAGVVYAPAHGVIFAGSRQHGARRAEVVDGAPGAWRSIRVRTPPDDGYRIVASRSHLDAKTRAFLDRQPGAEVVRSGSSLKFCTVAAGEADLYPRFGPINEWDTAAGDAVLRAAGGVVTTHDGAPLTYGKPNFLNPPFFARGAS